MMETRRRVVFPGHFDWDANEGTSSFVCAIEYELFDPTSLDVRLMLLGDEEQAWRSHHSIIASKCNYLRLHSDREGVPSVEVLGIRGINGRLGETEINAGAVEVGISEDPLESEVECWALAELMPSGILGDQSIREFSPTGEIKKSGGWEGSIQVTTAAGTFHAGEATRNYEVRQYGNRVTHLVERAVIRGRVVPCGRRSLREIHENLVSELDDICLVLSLCYRQRVRYYELSYDILNEGDNEKRFREAHLRLKHEVLAEKRQHTDELVHYRDLVDGGLDSLVTAFRRVRDPDALRRCIVFLSASFEPQTVESCYFFAYSALESVLSAVDGSTPLLLTASRWKKLEKSLREHLDEFSARSGLTDIVVMKNKLPELRRTPAVQHIEKVCRGLGVKTNDLWIECGFTAGVKLATSLRNDLFHSALCEDARDINGHLVRLRVLTERIILKILRWPDEKIWVHHDQVLKWANMGTVDSSARVKGNSGSSAEMNETKRKGHRVVP